MTRQEYLTNLVNEKGWTKGAELGVWDGRTYLKLLANCPELTLIGVDVWAVLSNGMPHYDTWNHTAHEKVVREKSAQFGDRAVLIKGKMNEVHTQIEDGSLDFIFIDGDHRSEAVREDIKNWAPKVKKGGWVIGHDIDWASVRVVVEEIYPGYVQGPDNVWSMEVL